MAIETKGLYETFMRILNMNNSEYISPEEFVSYLTLSSEDMYNDYLGNRTARRAVYGSNSITDARLNPFKRVSPVIVYDPSNPVISKPNRCKHIMSVRDTTGDPIMYQDDNRFVMLRKDSTVNLKREAYYREMGDELHIETERPMQGVIVDFLESPKKPELPYTVVGREVVITDADVVNLEWDEGQASNLINRILIYAGITLKDTAILQVGRLQKSEE